MYLIYYSETNLKLKKALDQTSKLSDADMAQVRVKGFLIGASRACMCECVSVCVRVCVRTCFCVPPCVCVIVCVTGESASTCTREVCVCERVLAHVRACVRAHCSCRETYFFFHWFFHTRVFFFTLRYATRSSRPNCRTTISMDSLHVTSSR